MKRSQIQGHATENDSPDSLEAQSLNGSKKATLKHQNQNSLSHDSVKNGLIESDDLEPENYSNGHASNDQAAIAQEFVENNIDEPQETLEKPKIGSQQRRGLMFVIGAIALTVGSIFGFHWWQFQSTHVSTDNAQIKGHVSPISAQVSATVKQALVNDGDYVKPGQTLLILEDQDLNLKVQQAEANLAAAQAALQSARDTVSVTSQTNFTQIQQAQSNLASKVAAVNAAQANVSQTLAKVDTNRASIAKAQTALNRAQADLQRYQALYNEGAIPAQQLDTAQAAYANAQAELVAAQKTVTQAQADVKNAQAQLQSAQAEVAAAQGQVAERQVAEQNVTVQKDQQQQAQAQVKQAQAQLQLARQQITYTTIKAPVGGYVGQLTAQVGQKVQAGQPLLSIVPLQTDAVYVDANFKETTLGKLQVGEKADVELDAYPGEVFSATIAGVSPATGSSFALIPPDNATGNFNKVVQWIPIRLVFDPNADPDHKLRPGLSVKVTVDTTTAPSVAAQAKH